MERASSFFLILSRFLLLKLFFPRSLPELALDVQPIVRISYPYIAFTWWMEGPVLTETKLQKFGGKQGGNAQIYFDLDRK